MFAAPLGSMAQSEIAKAYIQKYKHIAIKEMKRTGIPASITLAQAIVESASGESNLAKNANNHFGIKCKTEWTGEKIYQDDDTKSECFRVYPDAESSFIDHSNFLKYRPYYAALFELDPVDDSAWAYGLKKAGYATEKDYPTSLLKVIDMYELAQYNFPELVAEDDTVAKPSEAQNLSAPIIASKDTVANLTVSKDSLPIKTIDTVVAKSKIDSSSNNIALSKIQGIVAMDSTKTTNATITPMKGIGKPIENKIVIVTSNDTSANNTISNSPSITASKYPQNDKFKINQIAAVWAIAGQSYLAIAEKYNIPLYKIFRNNEIEATDLVQYDQIVFLHEKKNEGINKVHIVKKGETLYEISQAEGIKLSALKNYNQEVDVANVKEGTVLYLFKKTAEDSNNKNTDKKNKTENKTVPTSPKAADTTEKKKSNKFKLF
jgi:LysM repeat protein